MFVMVARIHPNQSLRALFIVTVVLFFLTMVSSCLLAAEHPVLMRFPTLHGNTIVFESGGNLWKVQREGGVATRLTSEAGMDIMPRFSPDGKTIAFTGEYDGNTDVYTIPADGGAATRLTFHSDVVKDAPMRWGPDNMVVTWTPDGKNILLLSRRDTFNTWFGRLFLVSKDGGLPTALPLPKGGLTSYSPDGTRIAYNRIFRNFRTWKKYYGGLAQDIWIYDFKTRHIERVTNWKGTDTFPMWYHDTIYFASDRGADERLNLWAYDLKSKGFRQITHFTDYDIDWPSLGDSGITFQCGGSLYVLDLPSEKMHQINVTVPSDDVRIRPRWVDAGKLIRAFGLSPNGKRALFEARGDIFTVPAKYGDTRDVTQTSNAYEQYPAWSPDGKWIAYITDRTGETEMAIRAADGSGGETLLTDWKKGYLFAPVWSPDSEKLAFSDSEHVLWYVNVKDKKPVQVDKDPRQRILQYSWAPDAQWLSYVKSANNDFGEIFLYSLDGAKATLVSTGMTNDSMPVFDPEGKYLYFVSNRHENPIISETEFNVATLKMGGIYVATLQKSEPSPFAPRSDEGSVTEAKKDSTEKPAPWKPGATPPIHIDVDGLLSRAVPLPIPSTDISNLAASKGHIYYLTTPPQGYDGPLPGEKPELHVFDLQKRKDHVLAAGLSGFALSADGMKVLYNEKKEYFIADALPPESESAGATAAMTKQEPLKLSNMKMFIHPLEEWSEMFQQAWRLNRDFFYSPEMNGKDWNALRVKYEKLLPLMTNREDLNYIIGELIGELQNSHCYIGGGDSDFEKSAATGLLGVDFGLDASSGRYTFKKIYAGDNSREDFRSPLTEPGVDVKEGSYLLAVNGHELRAPTNPYSLFVNTLDQTVTLTVADDAAGKGKRDVTVKPIQNELNLRLKAWIDHNREVVDQASGGKIGYVYLSDMEQVGMDQFVRQFYPQIRKEGLIIDVRWNGGGNIDQILLERLRRVLIGMNTNRSGTPFTTPSQVLHGFMVCLANHYSASDGDIFPYYFQQYKLGPVIGTRTWGGVRGYEDAWSLLDGGTLIVSEDTIYGLKSEWVLENHGVEPNIEVDNLPGDEMAGKDAQLETGIKYILDKLKEQPMNLPPHPTWLPAYPSKDR